MKRLLMVLVLGAVTALWYGSGPAPMAQGQEAGQQAADPSAGEVERTVDETVGIAQRTQQQEDAWAAERTELLARYRDLKAQVAFLTEQRTIETERAVALQADVDELARRLEESARLEAGLQDTLLAVFQSLEVQVQADVPFLAEERSRRLQSLRSDLVRPDVDAAEKLRRMLEALLIEAAYGSDFEVYQEEILVGSDSLSVDVLRLGRLSVFWQTPDGGRAGEFDRRTGTWVELGSSERHRIGLAMDMAARRRSHDVIALPLGRIVP